MLQVREEEERVQVVTSSQLMQVKNEGRWPRTLMSNHHHLLIKSEEMSEKQELSYQNEKDNWLVPIKVQQ